MKSQSRRMTETFSYWQQTAPCGTDGHPCPPFCFSGFSLSPASTAAWWSWSFPACPAVGRSADYTVAHVPSAVEAQLTSRCSVSEPWGRRAAAAHLRCSAAGCWAQHRCSPQDKPTVRWQSPRSLVPGRKWSLSEYSLDYVLCFMVHICTRILVWNLWGQAGWPCLI